VPDSVGFGYGFGIRHISTKLSGKKNASSVLVVFAEKVAIAHIVWFVCTLVYFN